MAQLNDNENVNDLLEALVLASSRKVEIKIPKESTLQIVIDGVPYEFAVDFDPHTQLWFLKR